MLRTMLAIQVLLGGECNQAPPPNETCENECSDSYYCPGELQCVGGCCEAASGSDPLDDCSDSYDESLACTADMDITDVVGSCTAAAATVRATVAGGPPVAEPAGSNQRQCQFLEGGGGDYVVMTASAFDGPYTCSALLIAGGPPGSLPLGPATPAA